VPSRRGQRDHRVAGILHPVARGACLTAWPAGFDQPPCAEHKRPIWKSAKKKPELVGLLLDDTGSLFELDLFVIHMLACFGI
jgi:hypothetical protein